MDYTTKTYGRNQEVADIFRLFDEGRDVSMPGPRRLGKSFVLDRIAEAGAARGWHVVKVEVAGCSDVRSVFRRLCDAIGRQRSGGQRAISWIQQRLAQVGAPISDVGGPWYQPLLSLDYEAWFERLVGAMNDDTSHRWALLIDELPIFLKALHDRGTDGVAQALDFMNLLSRLRNDNRRVRWLITGSIGIEPLARAGNYLGVLAKFNNFQLDPLNPAQAADYVRDLATTGRVAGRSAITQVEADAIASTVGWRTAYYLDLLAQELKGEPTDDPVQAGHHVAAAADNLLRPNQLAAFGIWEEHIRKHYPDRERDIAFGVLNAIATTSQGKGVDTILTSVARADLASSQLRATIARLHVEGFVTVEEWESENPIVAFRNPLLRRWWARFPP